MVGAEVMTVWCVSFVDGYYSDNLLHIASTEELATSFRDRRMAEDQKQFQFLAEKDYSIYEWTVDGGANEP